MDTKNPLTENETITIDGTAYSIDAATASALKEGVIPTALQVQMDWHYIFKTRVSETSGRRKDRTH